MKILLALNKSTYCFLFLLFGHLDQFSQSTDSIMPHHTLPDSVRIEMQKQKEATKQEMQRADIKSFIIKGEENTFGYMIFIDGQMYIEQKTMPGQAGNLGFKTQALAEKCAALVITKMKKGEMPPTINKEDIHKLSIN